MTHKQFADDAWVLYPCFLDQTEGEALKDSNEALRAAYIKGCEDTLNKVKREVERLINVYGAFEPRTLGDKEFQDARLMGYEDVKYYLDK